MRVWELSHLELQVASIRISQGTERNCMDSRYILDEEDIELGRGLCVGLREQGKKNIY